MKKKTTRISIIFILLLVVLIGLGYFVYQKISEEVFPYILPVYLGFVILSFVVFSVFLARSLREAQSFDLSKQAFINSKTYLVEINKQGKIQKTNNVFNSGIKDSAYLKTIADFNLLEEQDIMKLVSGQKPFFAIFEGQKEPVYIRFFPIVVSKGYYLIGENITTKEGGVEFYKKLAFENSITGLPNKNELNIKMDELFTDKEALSQKNSLVAINITQFKRINRLFGMKVGDATLKKIGRTIQRTLSEYQAYLFNPHLDNYLVLFRNLDNYQEVVSWSERLFRILERPIAVQGNLFTVEIKMGIFHLENEIYPNLNPYTSITNAELALKKAKGSRRLKAVVFDMGLGQLFTRDQAMENDLVTALENNEMTMYYQPQVYNNHNRVYGFEALLRWNNPKYMHESPIHFIRLAEENNMIYELGRFVIDETFKFAKEIEPYDVRVSLNISPVQILQSGFVNEISNAFKKYQLKKNVIIIEITETFLMESYDLIIDKLLSLKDLGISIHLDNFGSGYSSLLYLKSLPIDGISIHHEFIKNINSDRYARAIVTQLISLAQSLDLEVIAEGVENQKQSKFLADKGCRIIQGYMVSKAITRSQAMKFITDYNTNMLDHSFDI